MSRIVRPYGDTTGDGMVQMSFTLPLPHDKRAEGAALQLAEKMGMKPALLEGEVAEKNVHAGRKIRDRRLDHQVQMVRHQDPRMEDPLTLEHDLRELLDELPPIPIAADDIAPLVAAARDVMDAPRRVVT